MSLRGVLAEAGGRLPAGVHRRVPLGVRTELRYRLGRYRPGDIAYRPVPPPVPPGEEVGPPDVVLMGADSGARWLFRMLADHPGATPAPSAGAAGFFSRFCTSDFTGSDAAAFHRFFPRRPGRLSLHRCDDALAYPWIAPLLAEAAPGARLVVAVRDPIDRLQSGLARTAEHGEAHVGSYLADAEDRGRYGDHLARLLRSFDTGQILVVQAEQWERDPDGQLARLYRFAGLAAGHHPPDRFAPPLGSTGVPLGPEVVERLVRLYADDVEALARLVPELDVSLWPRFSTDRSSADPGRRGRPPRER